MRRRWRRKIEMDEHLAGTLAYKAAHGAIDRIEEILQGDNEKIIRLFLFVQVKEAEDTREPNACEVTRGFDDPAELVGFLLSQTELIIETEKLPIRLIPMSKGEPHVGQPFEL